MRFKLFAFTAMLLMSILPAVAQETPVLNTVSFNGYGFSYADNLPISNLSVNITRHAGDPPDALIPGGAQPPYTRFDLYLDEFTPDPTYYPWTDVTVLFYNTADVSYSYPVLRTLLKERPALTSLVRPDGSDILPVRLPGAGIAVLQARPHYIETENVTGISYLLSQSLSVDPIYQSSYLYMFQGISQDDSTYITVVAPLYTLAVPETAAFEAFASEPDAAKFEEGYTAYYTEAAKMVDEATPDQFTPNLDHLDAFARTITVK